MINRVATFIVFFSLCLITNVAESGISRFFPVEKPCPIWSGGSIGHLPDIDRAESSVDNYNAAVELNNQGLDAMDKKQYNRASSYLLEACRKAPGNKEFWKNYLIVLNSSKKDFKEIINVARILLAFDINDSQAASIAGFVYLNDLDEPHKSIPYFEMALRGDSDNTNSAMALVNAFDKCDYKNNAFEILQKYASKVTNDPYPQYMLGLHYLEHHDYNLAIKAFSLAKKYDDKGFVYDAWIRARYLAGQLEGLEYDCRQVLQRFPNILNRSSLERILFSLQPGDFRFIETIKINLDTPSSLESLEFSVRRIPNVENHQWVQLISSEFITRGRSVLVSPDYSIAGSYKFYAPREVLAPDFFLRLTYRIRTQALFGSRIARTEVMIPSVRQFSKDPLLSLNNRMLSSLYNRLTSLPGNYAHQASKAVVSGLTYQENYQDYSVEWALSNPDNCDCTEFARLLTALCLKKGIPARIASGFLIKPELMNKETAIGHAWCEIFFAKRGWIPIDPTLQITMDWAYFGNLLSDQILFDHFDGSKRTRVSIDYVSTKPDMRVNLGNSYNISHW